MSNEIKDLEHGDVVWFALNESDMPDTAEVEEITSDQVSLRWEGGLLVADASKFHLLEKWWGHGPLGDGTGMGPDGFDIGLCNEEDIDQFPWLKDLDKMSNEIKGLEKEN